MQLHLRASRGRRNTSSRRYGGLSLVRAKDRFARLPPYYGEEDPPRCPGATKCDDGALCDASDENIEDERPRPRDSVRIAATLRPATFRKFGHIRPSSFAIPLSCQPRPPSAEPECIAGFPATYRPRSDSTDSRRDPSHNARFCTAGSACQSTARASAPRTHRIFRMRRWQDRVPGTGTRLRGGQINKLTAFEAWQQVESLERKTCPSMPRRLAQLRYADAFSSRHATALFCAVNSSPRTVSQRGGNTSRAHDDVAYSSVAVEEFVGIRGSAMKTIRQGDAAEGTTPPQAHSPGTPPSDDLRDAVRQLVHVADETERPCFPDQTARRRSPAANHVAAASVFRAMRAARIVVSVAGLMQLLSSILNLRKPVFSAFSSPPIQSSIISSGKMADLQRTQSVFASGLPAITVPYGPPISRPHA